MNQLGFPILSLVMFFPVFGALILMMIDKESKDVLRGTAVAFTVIEFFISLPLVVYFNDATHQMQFVELIPWIKSFGINYHLGIDGISLWIVMLTTFLTPICVLCSWTYIQKHVKEYMVCLLILETAMLGALLALDLILFYVFWELMLIPMYMLIGVWGGVQRIYAAVKFFIFTAAGSVFMLLAILFLYYYNHKVTGIYTFNILELYNLDVPVSVQFWLCLAFFVSFAIKVPMFPLHTWLPDAHVQAPTAGSVILAGVLLKMGTYGFLRFAMPLFPYATHQFIPVFGTLAVIGIVYGALVAMVQPDMKKLVAYSSVSHLGYVMIGLFALNMQGIEGAIYQMLNHGISTGALFLIVGMLYERRHTRMIKDFGGVAKVMPVFATFFMIATLSSVAVPGTNGFVGEIMILVGAFRSFPVFAIIAASGAILGAVYMLWMYQRVMFCPLDNPENQKLKDLNVREIVTLLPLAVLVFVMGFFPGLFLRKMDASVSYFLNDFNTRYEHYVQQYEGNLGSKVAAVMSAEAAGGSVVE
ncbi:MAG: NADH-quinone oxidoreductase subunit M [Deltaproteobacteria bacterium]|nr:NADH-quinone oxidoreductase subunit M [Candidatus Anaeroferrophillus wilburensis]MBN2889222.1 NADH-quinone oxidoreductase subunit M [Deltaproteobacteria bacterium]